MIPLFNEDLLRLDGRSAIVTGAAMGIGRAISERLTRAGAAVLLVDRDAEALVIAADELAEWGRAEPFVADMADLERLGRVVDECTEWLGVPDILVNNAGIFPMGTVVDLDELQLERVLAINLQAAIVLTHHAAVAMIARGRGGRILNITSIDAVRPSMAGLAAYDASKHGLWGFTKSAALELAPHGITVNALAPGGISTPGAAASMVGVAPGEAAAAAARFLERIPLGRMGVPDDIAKVALAMVSDVGSYMTGTQVVVDGGALLV